METQQPTENNEASHRLYSITFILTLISTLMILILGTSLMKLNRDVRSLNQFMLSSQNIQSNFEQSLQLYTESTKNIIAVLLKLRPSGEEDYINFISQVEDIAEKMNLSIELQSETPKKDTGQKVLYYRLSLLAKRADVISFLSAIEALPYYTKVEDVSFTEPSLLDGDVAGAKLNTVINLDLNIK